MKLIQHIEDLKEVCTSHSCGNKKVLVANEDTQTNITQIAITRLASGEIAKIHTHHDMEEWFFVTYGSIDFTIDNNTYHCKKGDFVTIPIGSSHELKAIKDSEMITIGCKL